MNLKHKIGVWLALFVGFEILYYLFAKRPVLEELFFSGGMFASLGVVLVFGAKKLREITARSRMSAVERGFWIGVACVWVLLFCWIGSRVLSEGNPGVWILLFLCSMSSFLYLLWIIIPARILLNLIVASRRRPHLLETFTCIVAYAAMIFMLVRV